jgi:hypothetical protein
MDFQGNAGVCRLLQMLGTTCSDGLLNRGDMGWPDLLSKLAVMVMMMIDNLVSPMISPR